MTFTPVIRTSNSIVKTLLEFAKERTIDVKLLDFELISYETLMKKESDEEYKIIKDSQEITKDDLNNSTTIIIQEYSIKIMPLTKSRLHRPIKLSIATNKLKTRAILTIHKGSIFTKKENLLQELKSQVFSKKLKAGLFIGIFEPKLDLQLKKLLSIVPFDKVLAKDLKFTVALGIEPIAPIDAQIEKVFEQKESISDSIIDGVDIDELVIRYIKPIKGKDGRSCNGKYISVRDTITKNLKPTIDNTITIKDHPEFIEYFAHQNGFVLLHNGYLTISKQLKLDGASFKSTANIDGGESDKDISVHIAHNKSHSEDAVGSGVNIDVKELNIDGSVGSNVKIKTQELNIDAQTHRNSKMEVANSANVKLHRGDLVATDATIDVLETGKITAHKSIHIKKMLGGEAIAPIVRVDELLSNSTIIASKLIEIQTINGKDNKLIIDPNSIESYHKDLENLNIKINNLQTIYKDEESTLEKKVIKHTERIDRIKVFQQRILSAKKSGRNPTKQDIIRVKEFKRDSLKLKDEEEKLLISQQVIEVLLKELETMKNIDFQAKIITNTSYDGHTKVIFINLKTKEETMSIPEGLIEKITLIKNNDGDRVIKFS